MAVDPYAAHVAAGARFIVNSATTLFTLEPEDAKAYLINSASQIVLGCPPTLPWAAPFRGDVHRGLFAGPTSIAYFFWSLSTRHPDLEIEGRRPLDWCRAYLDLAESEEAPRLLEVSCGITNEFLASNAIKACVYRNEDFANELLEALRNLETDPTYCEWMKGRAGALYILRIMREWLPDLATAINPVVTTLIEAILSQDRWVWNGNQYIGPVHGDIGIVTQIVLSDALYAPKLESKLLSLLKLQDSEGNWPIVEYKDLGLAQFCHGAPGFVLSLLAIRRSFPTLRAQIDAAVTRGRKVTWEKGILKKEPNICHGIIGNALALEPRQRDHFFALAAPEKARQGIKDGKFGRDEEAFGLLWGEAGRAWAWMDVWDGAKGKLVLYTDV